VNLFVKWQFALCVVVRIGSNLGQSQYPISEVVMGSSEEEYKWFD